MAVRFRTKHPQMNTNRRILECSFLRLSTVQCGTWVSSSGQQIARMQEYGECLKQFRAQRQHFQLYGMVSRPGHMPSCGEQRPGNRRKPDCPSCPQETWHRTPGKNRLGLAFVHPQTQDPVSGRLQGTRILLFTGKSFASSVLHGFLPAWSKMN